MTEGSSLFNSIYHKLSHSGEYVNRKIAIVICFILLPLIVCPITYAQQNQYFTNADLKGTWQEELETGPFAQFVVDSMGRIVSFGLVNIFYDIEQIQHLSGDMYLTDPINGILSVRAAIAVNTNEPSLNILLMNYDDCVLSVIENIYWIDCKGIATQYKTARDCPSIELLSDPFDFRLFKVAP